MNVLKKTDNSKIFLLSIILVIVTITVDSFFGIEHRIYDNVNAQTVEDKVIANTLEKVKEESDYYSTPQTITITNNITDLLFEKYYPLIKVDYESDSLIVLEGNKNDISQINGSVVPFWESIDIVKNQGYSLKEIITLGTGTDDNTTIFYAIFINNSSKIEK